LVSQAISTRLTPWLNSRDRCLYPDCVQSVEAYPIRASKLESNGAEFLSDDESTARCRFVLAASVVYLDGKKQTFFLEIDG